MFLSFINEDIRTLYETFRRGAYESNNGPCLGWRDSLTSPYQVMNLFFFENYMYSHNMCLKIVPLVDELQ